MIHISMILAGVFMTAAPGQEAPVVAVEPAAPAAVEPVDGPSLPDGPLTWDKLPEPLRASIDSLIGKPIPQAVVVVDAPVTADVQARRIDHGMIVSEQTVRPAAFAAIATPARNARKYGPAGALLWRGVSEAGEWWCWRNDDNFPNWRWPSDIYCYRDADSDGAFDKVMENSGEGFIFYSRYQFRNLGHDERLRDIVTYQTDARPVDPDRFVEKIVVRYDGPASGRIQADGRLTDGELIFDLLTGAGVATSPAPTRGNALVRVIPGPPDDGLTEIGKLIVKLDKDGRGSLSDPRGIVLEVDRVNADGSADIRVVSGVTQGETLLFPRPTRETFVAMIQEMRDRRTNSGGSPP
ncbi:hypothetical protein [Brevundimonas mediterranea]|uniref:Uncharacterized protein n=1 Tax=Brevundimonas mediterranea TaxID=74329 RepID=A0A7W6A2K0_9CAUL|nr:hypothetical protein [Brevundimonas mediterranea]MBB3872039.1 hypothetical protein [Brevundimonas mediterranea]